MESSHPRWFGRVRSVHDILGGGFIADVVLWRRRNVTVGILLGAAAAWMVFDVSGYTLLSLVSNVLLLLLSILFVWAKAASVLNRPPPPIPGFHLSQESVKEATAVVHSSVNTVLSGFRDIALGKDLELFYKVAVCLWFISVVGSATDFLTLGYTTLVIVFTVPVLYEKYEDTIDKNVTLAYVELRLYERVYEEWFHNFKDWIIEIKKQLS